MPIGRHSAIGTPGLMGSQAFGAGQAAGMSGMVCLESFVYDTGDGRSTIVSAGTVVPYGDPVLSVAPQRFVDTSAVSARPVLIA